MNPRVTRIEAAADGKLLLRFTDGDLRSFDLAPYIARGGVFASLSDPAQLAEARVVSGSIEWPGEVDLSYDTLYLRSQPVSGMGREAA